MTVKLTVGGAVISNKPPQNGPSDLYPGSVELSDGRTVMISDPQPDKIVILGALKPAHFVPKPSAGMFASEVKAWINFVTIKDPANAVQVGATKPAFQNNAFSHLKSFELKAGSRSATSLISLKAPKSVQGDWQLRLEMNPRKVGPGGLALMLTELGVHGSVDVGAFLREAKITRLDAAVDFLGLPISEFAVQIVKPGKRALYTGPDGTLQSIYFYANETGPLGPLRAVVYDRLSERAEKGKSLPTGDIPVVRVEVRKTWKSHAPLFRNLPASKNPFKVLRIGSLTGDSWPCGMIQNYAGVRRTASAAATRAMLKLSEPDAAALESVLSDGAPILISSNAIWARWKHGLKSTGLSAWVDAASPSSL